MKTVIMAGGFGTRLRPLTQTMPKPMVPVANLPMLHHIVNLLKKHNLRDYVTLLYFQPEEIKKYFKDGADFDVRMEYMLAEADYGTAGAVKFAEDFYRGSRVLVISGDVLTDFDLTAAIEFHKLRKAQATIVLTRMENPLQYGVVITHDDGRISRFLEKPTWGEVFSDTINTAIYILEPEVFDRIPPGENFDFSQNLFPGMLRDQEALYGYVAEGYWRDIGNLSEYQRSHQDILQERVRIDSDSNKHERNGATIWLPRSFHVDEGAIVEGRVILGDDVRIAAGARVRNSVIGSRCTIAENASVENSVIWHDTEIQEGAYISQAIICNNVLIERDVTINEEAVISDHVKLREGATVRNNCKIWPGKEVEAGATVSSSLIWGEKWTRELFTDSKVTGLANVEVTPEFAAKLGTAFGATLTKGSSIVVSRGVSAGSRVFSRALISGVLSGGVNVIDLRTLPIPLMRYELKSGRHTGGVYIRQSPEDYRITDLIFLGPDGMDLSTKRSRSIETLFAREDYRRADITDVGQLDYSTRILESYRADFLKNIEIDSIRQRKFKVVMDFAHGGASEIFGGIFASLEMEIISLNAYPDPTLPLETEKHGLLQMQSIVRSVGADLGIQIGRSAEKMIVVDSEGDVLSDQMLLLIVTSLFLSNNQARKIAVPVMASMGIEAIAAEFGVSVTRVRSDHLAMMQAFQQQDVEFVGGTRGGFLFSKFQLGADAMFSAIKMLELLARSSADLLELRKGHEKYHSVSSQVPCPWAKKGQVMRLLMEHTEGKNRQLIDGARFQENGSWVWIAPSRNEAYFTIFAESENQSAAESLAQDYERQVRKWQEPTS